MKQFVLVFLLIALFAPSARADSDKEFSRGMSAGYKLSFAEATTLEKELAGAPKDLEIRGKLVGYYIASSFYNIDSRDKLDSQKLWLIEHHPESTFIQWYCKFAPPSQHYPAAKALWEKHLETKPEDLTILSNAGLFFLIVEPDRAETIYKKLIALQPDSSAWRGLLSVVYNRQRRNAEEDRSHELAQLALAEMEKALELSKDDRIIVLTGLPDFAFNAGDPLKAREYAETLLMEAETRKDDPNYWKAIQAGHTALGRVALGALEIHVAKEHLLASAKIPALPRERQFTPRFELARDLLERGENEAVLEYLKACEPFWAKGRSRLKDWQETIRDGDDPDFVEYLND